jgi:hypothetical protein
MKSKKRRVFGPKINFKSLSCAPINEHGVVYLFGVLHDAFDFKIESVQAGFPDCIARRQIGKDRWEEIRIEFEFNSRSFLAHNHDPDGADMIVCWNHDWSTCPEHIEVIELSSMIKNLESIAEEVKEPKKLSAYNEFCRQKRREGYSFQDISRLWGEHKATVMTKTDTKRNSSNKILSDYQSFCKKMRAKGKTFAEIGKLWKEEKSKKHA